MVEMIEMISIIVCTYNDSHFLPKALNSCLQQNMEKEIIVVDDASTSFINSEAMQIIIDNKIKLIHHVVNKGLSGARNTGISAAKYDYVIPLDADDIFHHNSVKILAQHIDSENDVFYGNIRSIGNINGFEINQIAKPKMYPFMRDEILKENPVFCSSIFSKKLWKTIGGYKERKGAHYEDWNFWLRALMAGFKFKYVDVLVYDHTERSDSMLRYLENDKQGYVNIATEEFRKFKGKL
jgi:glycosyltransferase involved in cell wall biosynthesis